MTPRFTHLLPDEVENYLSEVRRVLASGGRCLTSFFLLNEESLDCLRSGSSTINVKHDFGEYRTKNASSPEAAIAYPEGFISFQDIVVALKEDTPERLL